MYSGQSRLLGNTRFKNNTTTKQSYLKNESIILLNNKFFISLFGLNIPNGGQGQQSRKLLYRSTIQISHISSPAEPVPF